MAILESAYDSSNVDDSSNSESTSEESSENSSASVSDSGSDEMYEESSDSRYEDDSDSSSVDRSWESAAETGEDKSESESLEISADDGEGVDLRYTEEREEDTEEEKYESESSESSSGDESSSSYASADDDSISSYASADDDSSSSYASADESESESSSREEETNESTTSEEESESETSENSRDDKVINRIGPDQTSEDDSKRKSTQMSLAEWLLQILMHEENKDEESGYDGHDQLLLFGDQGEADPGTSEESGEKGLHLSNLLSPFVLKRTEKDGSVNKYLVDEGLQNSGESLNLEYSDDTDDEELSSPDQKAENEVFRLGRLFLPLPTQEKGKQEEEEELLLLNLIMGHHQ